MFMNIYVVTYSNSILSQNSPRFALLPACRKLPVNFHSLSYCARHSYTKSPRPPPSIFSTADTQTPAVPPGSQTSAHFSFRLSFHTVNGQSVNHLAGGGVLTPIGSRSSFDTSSVYGWTNRTNWSKRRCWSVFIPCVLLSARG
jgi:hypothetical protein